MKKHIAKSSDSAREKYDTPGHCSHARFLQVGKCGFLNSPHRVRRHFFNVLGTHEARSETKTTFSHFITVIKMTLFCRQETAAGWLLRTATKQKITNKNLSLILYLNQMSNVSFGVIRIWISDPRSLRSCSSKEPLNPLMDRFFWCATIRVILDQWSWSPQRNTP